MPETVKLIECPRDAWQGLKGQIPAELKTNYLQALISAGFKHIDAVSFVSPNAVPQMADSEEVLKELDPPDDVEIIATVVNEKGAQRAIATDAVSTLGFPYSISPTFLQKNQRQTLEDAIEELEKIEKKADEAGLGTVVYISMAFGNPYGDPWSVEEVVEAVGLLEVQEIRTISLPIPSDWRRRKKFAKWFPRCWRSTITSKLVSICTAAARTPPRKSPQPMKPVADASIPQLAVSEDVPSRRMSWWGMWQRKS